MVESVLAGGEQEVPLCVDLDGTLIHSDSLVESFFGALRESFAWPRLLLALRRGRAAFKRAVADASPIDPQLLPFNPAVLDVLRARREAGQKIVLITAADQQVADAVAEHIGLFDESIGSNGVQNLKGNSKREFLVERYGEKGFDYVGDGQADLPVWRAARQSLVVTTRPKVVRQLQRDVENVEVVPGKPFSWRVLLRAFRVYQWVKNLLLFVPLLMAHRVLDLTAWGSAAAGFLAFSLCASAVYVINDLMDLEADRQHPTKSKRPFASGDLALTVGILSVPGLLLASALIALLLPPLFVLTLGAYFLITLAYSVRLKQVMLVDVIVLALLYTVRIVSGGLAAQVPLSEWLLAFSLFFFLSLAFVKRYSELFELRRQKRDSVKRRGYRADDLEMMGRLGASSGYISVLVMALYLNSEQVRTLYQHPVMLWFLCPVILYWVSRVWLLSHRGELDADPIVFAITDRVSYLSGAIAAGILLLAL